jgi:hypothetical protein
MIPETGDMLLLTRLAHSSGEFIESEYLITRQDKNDQEIGKSITYGRRYSYGSILSLSASEDDDDGEANKNRKQPIAKHLERKDDRAPDETITPDQIAHITSLGSGYGHILNQEFKKYGVKALPQLPKKHYDDVVRELMKNRAPSALAGV